MKRLTLLAALLLMSTQVLGAANCNANIAASTPEADFTDNGDGTVTHHKTGLMWACSDGLSGADCATGTIATYTWQQALQRVEAINSGGGFAGYTDWRLPNIAELASIIEDRCTAPAVNDTVFPATASYSYWSSTPFADSVGGPNLVWLGEFMSGGNIVLPKTANPYHVRLVRGQ